MVYKVMHIHNYANNDSIATYIYKNMHTAIKFYSRGSHHSRGGGGGGHMFMHLLLYTCAHIGL